MKVMDQFKEMIDTILSEMTTPVAAWVILENMRRSPNEVYMNFYRHFNMDEIQSFLDTARAAGYPVIGGMVYGRDD